MMYVRAILGFAMMVAGGTIVVKMLHYPIAQTFTGIVLGLAMMALGAYRLRQAYHARAAQQ